MANPERALQFGSEIQSEVMMTGLPDFDLAHGAGIVGDPSQFELIFPPEDHEPSERKVQGITVVSLDSAGAVTFRTATFGIDFPGHIAQVDNLGNDRLLGLRPAPEAKPKASFNSSTLVLKGYFASVNKRGYCTLGGVIVHEAEQEGFIGTQAFMSSTLAEFLDTAPDKRIAKLGLAVGGVLSPRLREAKRKIANGGKSDDEIAAQRKAGVFVDLTANATKRGDPVVVKRPLTAVI